MFGIGLLAEVERRRAKNAFALVMFGVFVGVTVAFFAVGYFV